MGWEWKQSVTWGRRITMSHITICRDCLSQGWNVAALEKDWRKKKGERK